MKNSFDQIYHVFLAHYRKQGWWPVFSIDTNQSEYGTGSPLNDSDRFEIAVGAILTQNVAWKNVEKALGALKKNRILSPAKLHKTADDIIASLIKPAGYYNQKTIKIKNFLNWFREYGYSFDELKKIKTPALRDKLLGVNGIGPETADSILLYALNRKIFVVDAYTKRIFSRLKLISPDQKYDAVQKLFHDNFDGTIKKYNEYHALIVAHGKDICRNKPLCGNCCIRQFCFFEIL